MAIKATTNFSQREGSVQLASSGTLEERRQRWVRLLRNQQYEPVIFDILRDELPKYTNSRVIDPADLVTPTRECALILASALHIFFAAVEGSLVSRIQKDANLQAEYTDIQQRAHHQPSIYVHLLADDEGHAPTPNQYLLIRDIIEEYLNEGPSEHAYYIDNITSPLVSPKTSIQEYRKYLHTPSTSRSPTRIATLHRFCTGITLRCAQIPSHLHNTPLGYPPCEVGYALNAHKRLAQHRLHRSSNYIMNLVKDICTYLHGSKHTLFPRQLEMHQHIVYLIFRPEQAAIAEILISGLLQCWIDGGGGFNAYPAGRSVASSRRVRGEDWQGYEMTARKSSALVERMRGLRERAEVWRRALDWESGDNKPGNEVSSKVGMNSM